ncbi:hypothetical protein SLEP1_g36843 [Rubroshorea leprosula]|uniref:Uncharacterized protein n=1 Tax=Rubroshorea leprosula TaxID=152421 RepID=A0AAV5KT21_9ROSI|nr:hypothetical protein SLEP1_g36843 [Rubroshorea leprosula]
MASRRGGSKRKQIESSSAGGQAQEEGNLVDNALFVDDDAINRYNFFKNLAVLPCNCVKFSQLPQGDMRDIPEGRDDEFLDVNHALVRATIAPNCTKNQIKVGFLTPENRALQWIISRIIAQRKGSKSYVLASDLPWFDYLLNRKRVNLGRYIFRSIIKPYSPTTGLPHGALITRLAKRNNIDLTFFRFGTVPGGTTFTKASFEKMDCLFRNGIWIKKGEQEGDEEEGDTDQEMAEQGAEEHEDDNPRPF